MLAWKTLCHFSINLDEFLGYFVKNKMIPKLVITESDKPTGRGTLTSAEISYSFASEYLEIEGIIGHCLYIEK